MYVPLALPMVNTVHSTHINSSTKWSGWNDSGYKHMLTTCLMKFPHYSVFCETKRPPEMNLETQLGFQAKTFWIPVSPPRHSDPWAGDQKTRPQVHGLYTSFNSSWLIVFYAWSPVAWYRYDTYTRCHIHHLSPPVNNLTNWANTNRAVSQGVSGDPNRHKRKSQLNEEKQLQCQHFHQNFKLFRSLRVQNQGVGEFTGKMH